MKSIVTGIQLDAAEPQIVAAFKLGQKRSTRNLSFPATHEQLALQPWLTKTISPEKIHRCHMHTNKPPQSQSQ